MAESCSLGTPHVRNHNGEYVESPLFKGLLTYAKYNKNGSVNENWKQDARRMYAQAVDSSVLEILQNRGARFTSLGEIVVDDFIRLTEDNEGVLKQKQNILKDFLETNNTKNLSEGIQNIAAYNRDNFSSNYMVTIALNPESQIGESESGFHFEVVDKTSPNMRKLERIVETQSFRDKLFYYLTSNGISTGRVETDEFKGRFSFNRTDNLRQTIKGLIEISHKVRSKSDYDAVLAEEGGHFIEQMLEGSALGDRLTNFLQEHPQVVDAVFAAASAKGEHQIPMGKTKVQEAAGILIGYALRTTNQGFLDQLFSEGENMSENNIDFRQSKYRIETFLDRITNYALKLFAKLTNSKIDELQLEAQQYAKDIARYFYSQDFINENYFRTLNTNSVFFNTKENVETKTFRHILKTLKGLSEELKSINRSAEKDIKKIIQEIEANTIKYMELNTAETKDSIFYSNLSIEGIAIALDKFVLKLDKDYTNLMKKIGEDTNKINIYQKNYYAVGNKIRELSVLLDNAVLIQQIITQVMPNTLRSISNQDDILKNATDHIQISNGRGGITGLCISDLYDKLTYVIANLTNDVTACREAYTIKIMEEVYGSKYVNFGVHKVFKLGKALNPEDNFFFKTNYNQHTIAERVKNLKKDIGFINRWFYATEDSGDLLSQGMDLIVKEAKSRADKEAQSILEKVIQLRAEAKRLGIIKGIQAADLTRMREFYEVRVLPNGHTELTGNFLSPVNYDAWERERKAFIEALLEEFFEQYQDKFESRNECAKSILFSEYKIPSLKKWDKAHSVFNKETKRYEPNSTYESKQYIAFRAEHPEWIGFLEKIKDFKVLLDNNNLVNITTTAVRAPQIRGTILNKYYNRLYAGQNFLAGLAKTIGTEISDLVMETCDDTELGSDNTFNKLEDDVFGEGVNYERDRLNRITTYGINKLNKPNELGTDIFTALYAYGYMACMYKQLSDIVDTAEIVTDYANNDRTVESYKFEKNHAEKSRATERISDLLYQQIYMKTGKKISIGRLCFNKIVSLLSMCASFRYLGFNYSGGFVNGLTGTIRNIMEAAGGLYFNFIDLTKASILYTASIIPIAVSKLEFWSGGNYSNGVSSLMNKFWPEANKVALFLKALNLQDKNKEHSREYKPGRSKTIDAVNPFEFAMYPYSGTEHAISGVSALAAAFHYKVYDEKGKRYNLFEVANVEEITYTDDSGKEIGTGEYKVVIPNKYVPYRNSTKETKQKLEEANTIKSLIEHLKEYKKAADEYLAKDPVNTLVDSEAPKSPDFITTEGLIYANRNPEHYDIAVPDQIQNKTIPNLYSRLRIISLDTSALVQFENIVRHVNLRSHGNYNDHDKIALVRQLYWKAFMSMKGWILGFFTSFFKNSSENSVTKTDDNGMIVATLQWITTLFLNAGGGALIGLFKPFTNFDSNSKLIPKWAKSKDFEQQWEDLKVTKHQVYSVRKLAALALMLDLILPCLLSITRGITAGLSEPPDDGEDIDIDFEDPENLTLENLSKYGSFHVKKTVFMFLSYIIERVIDENKSFVTIKGTKQLGPSFELTPIQLSFADDMLDLGILMLDSKRYSDLNPLLIDDDYNALSERAKLLADYPKKEDIEYALQEGEVDQQTYDKWLKYKDKQKKTFFTKNAKESRNVSQYTSTRKGEPKYMRKLQTWGPKKLWYQWLDMETTQKNYDYAKEQMER